MTVRRLWLLCAILFLLLAGAVVLVFHYRSILEERDERPAFGPHHAAIIERAYRLEAARNRVPIAQIKAQDYPRVVSFPDRDCVQLAALGPPQIGGHSLYCFRKPDRVLVERHQVGE
jgi:hypothetical protein